MKIFYPTCFPENAEAILGTVFFMQKIVGFNRFVPWPCHFTSKLVNKKGIQLGFRSYPGWSPGCYIQAKNGIVIGNNLRMGPGVCLISANHDLSDYDHWVSVSPIVIGSNVWLGAGVKIMPGVTIGDNVVIAANSVVTKNIPDDSIAAGVPANVIRKKEKYRGRIYHGE